MKIVIDTNVIISAMFFGGRPRELMELLVKDKVTAFASPEIIIEYQETAEEISSKYPDKTALFTLDMIISIMNIIWPISEIKICRDPKDNKFIECAFDSICMYIVTGDKDLRVLQEYADIQIVTVSEFLDEFCSFDM